MTQETVYPDQEPPSFHLTEGQEARRRIVCAAVRHKEHGTLICGARHHNCMQSPLRFGFQSEWEQGFVDQFHKFLTREEAWDIALRQNQIASRWGGDEGKLFSENLY